MIHPDLVGELLGRTGEPPALTRLDAAVAWTEPGLETAVRLGARLRMFGLRAVIDTQPRDLTSAREWGADIGARHLVHAAEELSTLPVGEAAVERLSPDEVVARIAGADGSASPVGHPPSLRGTSPRKGERKG